LLVLLVDDDPDCRQIYRDALEHAGHTVLVAHNGIEGLRVARDEEPDLVLMDIAMPQLDGWSALRRLRERGATKDLRIVAITASATAEDAPEYLAGGFDGLLQKPISPEALAAAVEGWGVRR
jgi:CheY-like chemotaxis protein